MIISPIRQNSPISLIIIPLVAIVLWIPGFIHPEPPSVAVEMPLYTFADVFFRNHIYVALSIGLILIITEAFLLNYILIQHQVVVKKNWLTALLVVVFGSCAPQLLWPGPQQFSGLLLILVIHILLGTYRQDKSFGAVFNAGLLLGLASQIYLPSLIFFLFAFIAVIMLRPFIWREWVILIIGVTIPFIYGGVYFYWNDTWHETTQNVIVNPIANRSFFLKLDDSGYFLAAVTALVLLVSAGRLIAGSQASTLKTKKGVSVMIWFTIFALVASLPAQSFAVNTFRFVIYPFAFFASNYFLNARRKWIAEAIFTMLLLGIAVSYLMESGFTF